MASVLGDEEVSTGLDSESLSDEFDDEDDIEPKLKYERISGHLGEILKKDGASCIAVNSKLIIIGTNWGKIHVLDHLGNKSNEFSLHSRPVTMIDMDNSGDYIATCSHDKKVVIQGLCTNDHCQSLQMNYPVRCVALDPNYGKQRSKRRFIVGENQVILYEKALLGQLKATVLSNQNSAGMSPSVSGGTVRAMKWGGQFLAWATDANIRVMDMNVRQIISLIKRDHSLALGCEQYPPHMVWQDEQTLLIGWGDSVKVCRVRESERYSSNSGDSNAMLPYYVEIVYMFNTDFYVCGLGPLDKLLVILSYNKNPDLSPVSETEKTSEDASGAWMRPQVRVVEPLQGTYKQVTKDVLGIRCYQEYRPINYHLAHLLEDETFYIVCPQDLVVAKPVDFDDRMQWRLRNNKYAEALQLVEAHESEIRQYTVLGVGKAYLEHLMMHNKYDAAAQLCPKIFGNNKRLWEEAVVKFNNAKQLRALSPYLPQGPLLDSPVYQTVLLDLLHCDHQGFLQIVQDWPGSLYNVFLIINSVLEELARNPNNHTLLRALAHLYSNIEKHDKALAIYLKLQHTDVFQLISQHSLYGCVAKHIIELMSLDVEKTLTISSQHVSKIIPDQVIAMLQSHPQFLYQYLDKLYEDHRDLSTNYHNKMVSLYANYAPSKLLPLLLSSSSYNLQEALQICQARKLNQETVHLLVRMGNSIDALNMVLLEERNIKWAMRLCEEHSDPELWELLVYHSRDNPEYIRELLNNMGAHVDPLMMIQTIPRGMQITGLRDALTKIMHDYQLRISLQSGYHKILVSDGSNLLKKLISSQNAGIPVHDDTTCPNCTRKILDSEDELIIFYCRHVYHANCLTQVVSEQLAKSLYCEVCHNSKKRLVNF